MDSLDKLIDLFDYYHDQGWVEGSGLGIPDHETNRSSGYFVAVYLMREELKQAGRFEREIGAMNWYTRFHHRGICGNYYSPQDDGYDVNNGWDWNRVPGATTI